MIPLSHVLTPVNFDDKSGLEADDVLADSLLAPKLEPFDMSSADMPP